MRRRFFILVVSALLLTSSLQATGAAPLRDPTRPYSAPPIAPAKITTFEVTAILVSEKRRVAIVNGQRVAVGDEVDDAIVIEISLDELRLEFRGRKITARLLRDASRE